MRSIGGPSVPYRSQTADRCDRVVITRAGGLVHVSAKGTCDGQDWNVRGRKCTGTSGTNNGIEARANRRRAIAIGRSARPRAEAARADDIRQGRADSRGGGGAVLSKPMNGANYLGEGWRGSGCADDPGPGSDAGRKADLIR